MKYILFSLAAIIFFAKPLSAQTKDEAQITKILSGQQAAWNKGNIEEYMQGYWQNDSLMFIGQSGIAYGWKQTMENYKKHYPGTSAMGKLSFEYIEIKRLSAIYFFVVGKWHLSRSIGNTGGHFTLLFRKIKGKWVITSDHSS